MYGDIDNEYVMRWLMVCTLYLNNINIIPILSIDFLCICKLSPQVATPTPSYILFLSYTHVFITSLNSSVVVYTRSYA